MSTQAVTQGQQLKWIEARTQRHLYLSDHCIQISTMGNGHPACDAAHNELCAELVRRWNAFEAMRDALALIADRPYAEPGEATAEEVNALIDAARSALAAAEGE